MTIPEVIDIIRSLRGKVLAANRVVVSPIFLKIKFDEICRIYSYILISTDNDVSGSVCKILARVNSFDKKLFPKWSQSVYGHRLPTKSWLNRNEVGLSIHSICRGQNNVWIRPCGGQINITESIEVYSIAICSINSGLTWSEMPCWNLIVVSDNIRVWSTCMPIHYYILSWCLDSGVKARLAEKIELCRSWSS